jgi:hypothetical protein
VIRGPGTSLPAYGPGKEVKMQANPSRDNLKSLARESQSAVALAVLSELEAAEAAGHLVAAMRSETILAGALGFFVDDDE